jgi:hypothetical protein
MAELKCSDGTVVQISTETEKELRKTFGPKPEVTYKIGDIFWRDQECDHGHYLRLGVKDGQVGLCNFLGGLIAPTYNNIMNGYRKVQNLNAITMTEIRSMTDFPAGLRLVCARNLIVTER